MDNKEIYININNRGENITSTNLSDRKNSIEQEGGAIFSSVANALVYTNAPIIKYLLLNTDLNNSNVQFLVPKLNQLYNNKEEQKIIVEEIIKYVEK
jgi:hypothetical protein